MEEKIKEIVSTFIKVPAEQIGMGTPVDRGAIQSSILLHRMYARLEEAGVTVDDYASIKVFGDILNRRPGSGGNGQAADAMPQGLPDYRGNDGTGTGTGTGVGAGAGIGIDKGVGIDIEEVAALPRAADFRKDSFYTQNFTQGEIAYCILQPDPYASLTGLFAAKEAIVKANAQYRKLPFHNLEISHTAEGRPLHPGFELSISHAGGMAVAVAISHAGFRRQDAPAAPPAPGPASPGEARYGSWIGWIALLLAAAALLLALKH